MNSNATNVTFSNGKEFQIFSSNGKQVNMKISDEELAKRYFDSTVEVEKLEALKIVVRFLNSKGDQRLDYLPDNFGYVRMCADSIRADFISELGARDMKFVLNRQQLIPNALNSISPLKAYYFKIVQEDRSRQRADVSAQTLVIYYLNLLDAVIPVLLKDGGQEYLMSTEENLLNALYAVYGELSKRKVGFNVAVVKKQ